MLNAPIIAPSPNSKIGESNWGMACGISFLLKKPAPTKAIQSPFYATLSNAIVVYCLFLACYLWDNAPLFAVVFGFNSPEKIHSKKIQRDIPDVY
jgi:hypothetical protein